LVLSLRLVTIPEMRSYPPPWTLLPASTSVAANETLVPVPLVPKFEAFVVVVGVEPLAHVVTPLVVVGVEPSEHVNVVPLVVAVLLVEEVSVPNATVMVPLATADSSVNPALPMAGLPLIS